MAKLGISEFTFGYSFLYEQTRANWGKLKAAPVLPSLKQEKAVGWDAHLPLVGTDYYYQFKLSEYMSRPNAKYIADKTYSGPYYRLSLHKKDRNHQHQALKLHSQVNPNTYYVAPEFHSLEDFNSAFLAHQITNKSRLIPVEDCDDINDGDQHYISFLEGKKMWYQHSEKKRHERSARGEDLGEVYRTSRSRWQTINREYAMGLYTRTRAVVEKFFEVERQRLDVGAIPFLQSAPVTATRGDMLLLTADLLSAALGVTLVLVGEGN
jgi:hypothetical protein